MFLNSYIYYKYCISVWPRCGTVNMRTEHIPLWRLLNRKGFFFFFFSDKYSSKNIRSDGASGALGNSLIFLLQAKNKQTKNRHTHEVIDISDLSAAQHQKTNRKTPVPLGSTDPHKHLEGFPANDTAAFHRKAGSKSQCFLQDWVPTPSGQKQNHTLHVDPRTSPLVTGCRLTDRPASFLSLLLSCVSWRVCICPRKLWPGCPPSPGWSRRSCCDTPDEWEDQIEGLNPFEWRTEASGASPWTHLLHGFAENLFILVLVDVSFLVERLDGQLHLFDGPLLHVELLQVLLAEMDKKNHQKWGTTRCWWPSLEGPTLSLRETSFSSVSSRRDVDKPSFSDSSHLDEPLIPPGAPAAPAESW